MKKHFRTLLTLLFAFVSALCLTVGLTACNNAGGGNGHKHTYSTEWDHDSSNHWKNPECNDTTDKAELGAHVDSDEDGVCDVCKYEMTHKHTYEDAWQKSAEGHWHKANCSHTDVTSKVEPHVDTDTDSVCDVCEWKIEHEFATEYSIDEYGHWYADLCGHAYAEEYETHNFETGVCVCGVEKDESNIYNDYYVKYAEFLGNDVLDFSEWHASLGENKVKHVEITASGDVVYTYDNEGEDTTETVFFAKRTVNVTLTRGNGMLEDASFPNVSYKVVATVGEEEVDVATANSGLAGTTTVEFTPYYGASGANATYKLVVEEVSGYFAIENDSKTVVVGESTEAVEASFVVDAALGVGEAGKIPSANFSGADMYNEGRQTFGIKAPAGWYWLEYENSNPIDEVKASIDGKGEFLIYNTIDGAQQKGLIYVPEDAKRITLIKNYGSLKSGGSVTLTPYEVTEINEVGKTYYIVASVRGGFPSYSINVPAGDYILSTYTASGGNGQYAQMQTPTEVRIGNTTTSVGSITTTTYATRWQFFVTVGKDDNIVSVKGQKSYNASNFIVLFRLDNGATLEQAELGNDISVSFSASQKAHYRGFTAEQEGIYVFSGTYKASSTSYTPQGLRYAAIGANKNTENIIGRGSANRYTAGGAIYLKAGESIILNINTTNTLTYAFGTFTFNIKRVSASALTTGEAKNVALGNGGIISVVSYTATKAGAYPLTLGVAEGSEAANLTNVVVANVNTGIVFVPKTDLASATSYGTFVTLAKDETLILAFIYEASATVSATTQFPTIAVTVGETVAPKTLTVNTNVELTISSSSKNEIYTFTAPEAGTYRITVSSKTGFNYFKVLNTDGSQLINASTTYYTRSATLELEKDQTISLSLVYSNTTETTYTANFSINYASEDKVTTVKVNEGAKVEFTEESIVKYYTFTAPEEGSYTFFVSAESKFKYINIYRDGTTFVTTSIYSEYANLNQRFSLKKDEVVSLEFLFDSATNSYTALPTVYFSFYRATEDAPQKMEVNKSVEVNITLESQIKYYSFTASKDAKYKLILTSETTIAYVYVYNAKTSVSYIVKSDETLAYFSYDITLKKDEVLVLEVYYLPNTSTPITYPNVTKLSINYEEPVDVKVNTETEIEFSRDAQLASYKVTATDAGVYTLILSATNLKDIHVVNGSGTNLITKIASELTFSSLSLTLKAGEEYVFTFIYESNKDYPTITFVVNREEATELTLNTDKTFSFEEKVYTKYLAVTAPEAAYYTLVMSSATDLKDIKILDADTGATVVAKITASTKLNISTLNLTGGQKVTLLFVFENTIDYPTVTFRVEYTTPADLTLNTAANLTLDSTNVAEYYSFAVPADGVYAIQLEASNLQNVTVYNAATGAKLVTKIADEIAVSVTVSTSLKLTAESKLVLLVIYDGALTESYNLKLTIVSKEAEDVANEAPVLLSEGSYVKHLKYTATADGTFALSFTAAEGSSLDNIAVYDATTGAKLTLPIKKTFTADDTYEIIVAYSGTAGNCQLTFNVVEALLAPTGVTVYGRLVMWNPVAGATSYNVFYATTATGEYTKVNEEPVNDIFFHHDARTTTNGFYKVTAVNDKSESDQSAYATCYTSVYANGSNKATVAVTVPEGFPASEENPVYLVLAVGTQYMTNGEWCDSVCIKITGEGTFTATANIKDKCRANYTTSGSSVYRQGYGCKGLPTGWTYTAGSYVSNGGTTTGTLKAA